MNMVRHILLFIFFSIPMHAIEINADTSKMEILSQSTVHIDHTGKLGFDEIRQKQFSANENSLIGLGYQPSTALWIKFTLKNNSDRTITKVLEYKNTTTETIKLFDGEQRKADGIIHIPSYRNSAFPSFELTLAPFEERTYYIRASSKITALIAELILYDKELFRTQDYQHKSYLLAFFITLLTLLIFNFSILVFTRDKAYLYYVIYLVSIIYFQLNYTSMAHLYLYTQEQAQLVTKATIFYVFFMMGSIVIFTRVFLNTPQFPKIDFLFKLYLYSMIPVSILTYNNLLFNLNILFLYIPLGFIVVFAGFYALYKGVKEAKFYVIGWSIVIIALILTNLREAGVYDISQHFGYTNELSFALEALLFSIALAHRINVLNEEKSRADAQLIKLQQEEQSKLEYLVAEKTKDLTASLQEKELLYRELNHRVKNNLAMILSLIKLQMSESNDPNVQAALLTTGNRIHSIAELYEVLQLEENNAIIKAEEYCRNIVENIRSNFSKEITINYHIEKDQLPLNQVIYCGLILNELVTNAFKYAFRESGTISIELIEKEDGKNQLVIEDNGVGFNPGKKNSLGLTIVDTLATKQLFGTIDIDSVLDQGTKITIEWEEKV